MMKTRLRSDTGPGGDPLDRERLAWGRGALLIGVDEVGRGPLAGPVVAAAVAFPMHQAILPGVRDSKQVKSPARREDLAGMVRATAIVALGAASVREIAALNIRVATAVAMRRAVQRCRQRLGAVPAELVIDGLPLPELGETHDALVGGDARCHSIAAASLIAKVARDRLMTRLAHRRPGYGWETNAGYGTRHHLHALRSLGLTPHHRAGFCATATATPTLFDD